MANGFDTASKDYDSGFTFTKIGMAQRNRVRGYLEEIVKVKRELKILELNCGTGEDAIYFAELGHEILATDISQGMIEVARAKSNSRNINYQKLDIKNADIENLTIKFDLIFSNFGGFNCLAKDDIKEFLDKSISFLNEKGKLVLVLMPRNCFWEKLYFLLKGKFNKAKRRNSTNPVIAEVAGSEVETWYFDPEEILAITPKEFQLNLLKPIGIAIPPSYLEDSVIAKPPIFNVLKFLEKYLTNSFWAKYSDHYLIQFSKK